jgi:thioredoxin 1
MATVELTKNNLDSLIKENDILLIDFWAEWCGPCKMFGPIFEEVAEANPDMAFAKCDTDQESEAAMRFGIRSIPTLAIFREGILVFLQPGAMHKSALESILKQVRELDMDEIRAEIQKEKEKQEQQEQEVEATAEVQ